MEKEYLEYRSTYMADNANPFWACAVAGCKIPFPHEVGITKDREWKHVWADFYYRASGTTSSPGACI